MSSPRNLKLVTNETDQDIAAIAGDMLAAKKALVKGGPATADVLPPIGELRYDDLANSKRFLSIIGEDLLYCAESKRWLIWHGTHWTEDREDFVFDFAAEFAAGLYDEATDAAAFKNAQRANNRSGFNAFLELAERKKKISIDAFDNQPRLLNCKNGTLDLETGALRPHERDDRITRRVNCDYDADATSKTFDDFLETIQPDPAIRSFLQRSIGYSY